MPNGLQRRIKSSRPEAANDWASGVCRRLKAARQKADLSQPEAAIALGVTLAAYQKYESRSAMPSYLVPRACIAFRVPCWWLLTGESVERVPVGPPPKVRAHALRRRLGAKLRRPH